jgi:tetratricopeptide (TPR) repeat protein
MRRAVESNSKDASVRLDLAQLLAQLGKPEQAKPILAELVKEQPNNMAARDAQFRISVSTKDFDAARAAADAMVANQPKSPLGYFYQGVLAEEAKRTDDALRLYAQAADLEPYAIEPLQAQINLLVKSKRAPEALKRLDEVIARTPGAAQAPNFKGDLLFAQGNAGEAQAAFRLAIARAPKWWVPYRGLARVQCADKDPDAAIKTLRDAQSKTDEPDQLTFDLAMYLEQTGKPDEAIDEYEKLLVRSPRSEVAANNLAMLLVTYRKDAASLERAKTLSARFADSTNPSYLDTYGWVLFKHGDAAASVPVLERVVSKAPNAPVALYHLGMAQSQSGSTAQALDNLSRAINSGTKFSGLDEARATHDKLAKLPSDAAPKT